MVDNNLLSQDTGPSVAFRPPSQGNDPHITDESFVDFVLPGLPNRKKGFPRRLQRETPIEKPDLRDIGRHSD